MRTEKIIYEIKDGTHIFQIPKIIEGVVKPIEGKDQARTSSSATPATGSARDVTIARAETSRVRAFGRNWNFEGARPNSCGSTGAADAGDAAPKPIAPLAPRSPSRCTSSRRPARRSALLALLAAVERQLAADVLPGSASRCSSTASTGRSRARLEVAARLPRWSGDTLDLVVDFLTYVFVPAYAVVARRPGAAAWPPFRSRIVIVDHRARSISPTAA